MSLDKTLKRIEKLANAIDGMFTVQKIITEVRLDTENDYYSVPEAERDETLYYKAEALDAIEDYLGDMIHDLNKMIKEYVNECSGN